MPFRCFYVAVQYFEGTLFNLKKIKQGELIKQIECSHVLIVVSWSEYECLWGC